MQLPAANWVERRSQHAFHYRKRSRTVADMAEEAYLRQDISCGSSACATCAPTSPALSPSPPHLLLPDAAVLAECLDVFELPQVENVVLLTSVVRHLHNGGSMRRDTRLRALYADRRRCNVLFDNLHHCQTAPASLREQRSGLALLVAAEWYYEHLERRLPVVVLSDLLAQQFGVPANGHTSIGEHSQQQQPPPTLEPRRDEDAELDVLLQQVHIGGANGGGRSGAAAAAADSDADINGLLDSLDLGGDAGAPALQQQQQQQQLAPAAAGHALLVLEPGVHILSAADYFGGFWGHMPAVADVFNSIWQSKAEEGGRREGRSGTATGFRPHLSPAALEAGLAARTLLAGPLSASHRVRDEATVAVGGGRMVLVVGRGAMNRAVHGDRVAVRLLPREQWHRAASAAAGEVGGGGEDDEEGGGAEEDADEEGGGAEEDADEHDLLAATGDGEADVAADAPRADGTEAADPLEGLLQDGAAVLPTGEVVGVLQRWAGEVVACIVEEDERALAVKQQDSGRQEAVLCIPTDRRLPKIRLRSRQLHHLLGQRLVLRLDGWEQGSRYPHGHLVRSLGPINSLTSETDSVLVSSGVHWQPFSEGALRELPPIASSAEYVMPPRELAARRDLRGPDYLTCSIDPPGCTDVDDALSVRWLDDGGGSTNGSGSKRQRVEVGVHIADVSFFVRQGGLLDGEAAARCTTVYLVDRRLDMLPPLLSEDLCSLRSGQDRYAVSVLWTLDADSMGVLDTWFGRTLIRSHYQLEYSQAQAIMEGRPQPLQPKQQHSCSGSAGGGGTGEQAVPARDLPLLQRNLRLLAVLAERRREMRLEAGAVELESAELRFRTDTRGQPTGVTVKQEIPMMRIVAEMMILANAAVARTLHNAFPRAALLRRHPPPRREALAEVAALCEALSSPLELEGGAAALAASLAAAAAAAPPALGSLIKSLATRAMSEAEYFCAGDVSGRSGSGMSHFGLALPCYTHFTSPIRRYADVVVHRQLLAAVAAVRGSFSCAAPPALALANLGGMPGVAAGRPPPPLGPEVAEQAGVMNERHRTAKRAQKKCSDLYLLLLLHAQPHVEAATIFTLRRQALLVFLPKYHLKGVIHMADKAGVCRPPLRQEGDEQLEDASVLAYRQRLILVADGGSDGSVAAEGAPPLQLCIVEAASGHQVAAYRPMQRVWVQLSADSSRAHGPRLRMRLLADGHPGAMQAAEKEIAEAAASGEPGGAAEAAGISSLPRQGAVRPVHWPPGVEPSAAAKGPPPGFGSAAAAAPSVLRAAGSRGAASSSSMDGPAAAQAGSSAAPTEPLSLNEHLHAYLEQQEQGHGEGTGGIPLTWEATLPPLNKLPSSSSGSGSNGDHLPAVLHRVLRKLQVRAARLELRAGMVDPSRPQLAQCGGAAVEVRQQICILRQHLLPS